MTTHIALDRKLQLLDAVRTEGYAFVGELKPDESTDTIAQTVGVIERHPKLAKIQQLRPRGRSQSTPNLYSGNFGLGDFPLHTDLAHWFLPPRYVLLRCVIGNPLVRTRLLTWKTVADHIPLTVLRRARVKIRRPTRDRFQFLSVLQKTRIDSFFRWDSVFLIPDNIEALQLANFMKSAFDGVKAISMENRGDTLIMDNWRVLHGRSAITSDAVCRTIDRVYLGGLSL